MRTLFAGKAIEVIRVLLVDYPAELTLRAICGKAEVSLRWASVVANALIRENFALRESQKSALKIMAPLDLLKRWAAVNNFVANTKFADYYSKEEDVTKFFSQFKTKKGPKYALATLAGGLLTAPFVRPTNVHLYVKSKEDAKKWAERLGLMPVEKNGNVRFAIAESPGVFYGAREIDGVKVVSDVQLYVDLLNYPGRGEEAAQAVLRVIEKRWKEQKG
ncbi:hypothetical protein HZC09_01500 [Candidatus Micrarchaeota archaeon]|nr:hypothetical protein [Candidatus Micrarchaeota archaeon]